MIRFLIFVAMGLQSVGFSNSEKLVPVMPQSRDVTSSWWQDGFPGVVDGARWRRCVRTGEYAFVLNTETLEVPHLGAVSGALADVPKADLELAMVVEGKRYVGTGGKFSRFGGPRMIESGQFLQRADVTDLVFTAADGTVLNTEARFETAAWSSRLGMIFTARPELKEISAGEGSFGRVNGGFGLDGTNRLVIPPAEAATPASFTLEFWVFSPLKFKPKKTMPWLVCKNAHEAQDGNYGIVLSNEGVPEVRMNIGGGGANQHVLKVDKRHRLGMEKWNHLVISYDGKVLKFYVNGKLAGEKGIGKPRIPVEGPLVFGGRGDSGYAFRGVIDQVRLYDRPLSIEGVVGRFHNPEGDAQSGWGFKNWTFREDVASSETRPSDVWKSAVLEMRIGNGQREITKRFELPQGQVWDHKIWQGVSLALNPMKFEEAATGSGVKIEAKEVSTGEARPVVYEEAEGWHRVNLDKAVAILPQGTPENGRDAVERIRLTLTNQTGQEEVARLLFEKSAGGLPRHVGASITGVSAVLRDLDGNPTGIPVQLSKNWHWHQEGGVYQGQWFHGVSQLRLPPGQRIDLELTMAYGHWGGLPAASHAQLSLIGWGGNQRWDQSALGSWGESLCYDPEQCQAHCTITDVRPLMVTSMNENQPQWTWTDNMGGGDFLRMFDKDGKRRPHVGVRAAYAKQGPCLTEATYTGGIHGQPVHFRETVSLARSNDYVKGTYRIRFDVGGAMDFSRFVFFQIGADTYSSTREKKMAVGEKGKVLKEWNTQWGGDVYKTEPFECVGEMPWVSLHEASSHRPLVGASGNRGIVIREWKAVLGGEEAKPWIAERGIERGGGASTLDLVPPPGVTRFEKGDYIEATIEHLILPQFAKDYYGPNATWKKHLEETANTWKLVERLATGNAIEVTPKVGVVERIYPDVRVTSAGDGAEFSLKSGIGFVPVTITNLSSSSVGELVVNGQVVDQSVHGRDFWQTNYDPGSKTWSRTYNIPVGYNQVQEVLFRASPEG